MIRPRSSLPPLRARGALRLASVVLLAACASSPVTPPPATAPGPAAAYDLVILGGRVMDPESGLDAVRNVGIAGGVVRVVTEAPLAGRDSIDARGLVVAPGFIDLHQHAFSQEALRLKAQDGVTAAFEMELGVADVDAWYAALDGRSPIHYGATVGHPAARAAVLGGVDAIHAGETASRAATPEQIAAVRARLEHGLRRGALGVGLGVEYTPGATPWEVIEMFRAAATAPGAPVHVHVRGTEPPHHWFETAELFLGAVASGAPLHVVHANSSFGGDAPKLFEMIAAARARGLDVTTETYPWTASMTMIQSAPFDDWASWPDERFARFVWPPTGERLTRASFGRYREQGGAVVIEGMTEEKLRPTLESPLAMIVSDGVLEAGAAHPRLAGSYARVLGRYVREQRVLGLMEALRKMTLMPAQRLEARAPAMRSKGRIRAGADADIAIFDPATVIERATYAEPLLPSAGIAHVLVGGVAVVRDGRLMEDAAPGRAVRGLIATAARQQGDTVPAPPATRTVDVVDDYHGTRVADPYRWLEELASPEVRGWAAAQDTLTTASLRGDPLREWLVRRSLELDAPGSRVPPPAAPQPEGASEVVLSPVPGGDRQVLSVRRGEEEPRVLVDPIAFGPDVEIARFHVSPDGRHVAYALSEAGSEWWRVRVRRVADGHDLPEVLEDMLWPAITWTRDGGGFFYVHNRRPPPGVNTMFHSPAVLYHRLGTAPAADLVIHGTPECTTTLALGVRLTPDGRYLLVSEGEGAHVEGLGWTNNRSWLLDLRDPLAPDLAATPAPLTPDRTSAYELAGQRDSVLYFFTDRAAPRRRLVAVDVRDPAAERWRDVIPEQPDVLDQVLEVNGRWVAVYLRDAQPRVRAFELDGRPLRELPVAPLSNVHEIRPGPGATEVELLTSSFLVPPTLTRYDVATGDARVVHSVGAPFDTAAYEASQVWYASKDGTRVPMFLLHRRGIARDGQHPTLLHGYGASSQVTTIGYGGFAIAWAELGGVLAFPALRGGGEFGRGWYEAAILERKQTTFDDFIAAAEWLMAEGYTSPGKLAIHGASNGGLLVAATMAQRPELFAAAVAEVPNVDQLRFDRGRHVAQFGDTRDPSHFRALFAYQPLHRIRAGTCYPATLVTTALNDERAPAWEALKLTATLQAAQGCARPVLLRAHDTGGHLGSRGPDAWREDAADVVSFAARHVGLRLSPAPRSTEEPR